MDEKVKDYLLSQRDIQLLRICIRAMISDLKIPPGTKATDELIKDLEKLKDKFNG